MFQIIIFFKFSLPQLWFKSKRIITTTVLINLVLVYGRYYACENKSLFNKKWMEKMKMVSDAPITS